MDLKCRHSWKDEYMRNLFQLWNKNICSDVNEKSSKNHQRTKYYAKNNKTEEFWVQKEEEFRRREEITVGD